MLLKLKRKSDRVRDALRRTFGSPSPDRPTIYLEYMSWDGLEALVRALNDNPGEFRQLTPAVNRLSACVRMVDVRFLNGH
ncbi:hypothetical protein FRC12_009413 [Ceratobasidium sp. 428]|nr:hypothetical protein FRC12_009413 [Ceratobasidium sp. 428]